MCLVTCFQSYLQNSLGDFLSQAQLLLWQFWLTSCFSQLKMYFNTLLGEGSHPIFAREEIAQASTRGGGGPIDEHRRVVAIVGETPPIQSQGIY
jgi:hypothetical protein